MKYLKKYKLFESQATFFDEDLVSDVRDILADVSDKERASLVVDDNSIIIGIGDDDNLFSTIEESHLRDMNPYIDDLEHLNSYLESKGFKLKNAAVWSKSISHSYSDKWMKYDFDSVIEYIKRFKIVYIDIMYEKSDDLKFGGFDAVKQIDLSEAISISDYKEWSKDTNKSFFDDMGEYFKNFTDHDKNFYRIYFDLNINTDEFEVVIPDEITDFFTWFGPDGPYHTQMRIVDYNKGICTDKEGRQMRIGKLLNKLGEEKLLQTYNKSKENTLKNVNDIQVVISRHPYDIIGMSTDRGWTTCHDLNDKRYGGKHLWNIRKDLRNGSLIAYVIRKSDRNINNPISRCLILNSYNGLRVDHHVYGTNVPGFTNFLEEWLTEYKKSK